MEEKNETKDKGKVERSVVMIRPHVLMEYGCDAVQNIKDFYLKDLDLKIIKTLRFTFTRKKAEEFYTEHRGKSFYEKLMVATTEGESISLLIEGLNAVAKVRKINGHTDPRVAEAGTVRAKYGIKASPDEINSGPRNGVHSSDSITSATREEKIIWGSIKGLE